jgi:hypothetical protein
VSLTFSMTGETVSYLVVEGQYLLLRVAQNLVLFFNLTRLEALGILTDQKSFIDVDITNWKEWRRWLMI